MNISFLVRVIPGTAIDITGNKINYYDDCFVCQLFYHIIIDYRANNEDPYVFTSSTRQLPIRTQLVEDRAGEPIETFMICLPGSQILESMDAQAVQPTCVTITILDDDCKRASTNFAKFLMQLSSILTSCCDWIQKLI